MIRIVIAEDQRMLLGALGSLLNLEEDMEVVGQATKMFALWILKCQVKVVLKLQRN
jgi:DNA-binding NarL/FixJ family response regulator